MTDLIEKIKQSGLTGRSGSGFPTGLKWQMVKEAKAEKKYVICNASEGEPLAKKDHYILNNFLPEIVEGIELALKAIPGQTAYIYINKDYYREFKNGLIDLTHSLPIELFQKPAGYLSGEETVLINNIEGKYPPEPREKPPFPTEKGLWQKPTLINNLETFYWVSQIAKNKYEKERFFR